MNQVSNKWGIVIASVFTVSILLCLYKGVSLAYGLVGTLVITTLILKGQGVAVGLTLKWIWEGVRSIRSIYWVILLIGVNVSIWIASGIVPTLIYYGFDVMGQVNFILVSFLLAAVVSFFLGTGLGTLSTIGVALFSLGASVGLPKPLLVGALLSGAYVADRLSPISALVNFTTATVGVTFKRYFRKTGVWMLPAFILTGVIYGVLGRTLNNTISLDQILLYRTDLQDVFKISLYYLGVPLAILMSSFRGLKTLHVLLLGIGLGGMIGVLSQGYSVLELIQFALYGFETVSKSSFIQSLQIGGALSMLEVVLIIMGGVSISRIYEACGWIEPVVDFVQRGTRTQTALYGKTGGLSVALNALTCDQTVGILIPGKYLKHTYASENLANEDLAMVISNSGTALAPLMPWNVNALIILAITGVGAGAYAPYAFLCWISFPMVLGQKFLLEKLDKNKGTAYTKHRIF